MAKPRPPELLIDHATLVACLRYDPATGHFWPIAPRNGGRAGHPCGHVDRSGYRVIMVRGCKYLAHRLAWFYQTGRWPAKVIDHKNLSRDDNRWDNLREASHSQNHANVRSNNPVGLKGAVWNRFRGYWQSTVAVEGKIHRLGTFATAEEAHAAYVEAACRLQGEFARVA